MKFPKLDLVCANDELLPAMMCAKVDPEFTFASDAHILVKHRTSAIFKEEFVLSLPKEGIMIPRRALMLMRKSHTTKVTLTEDKKSIQLHQLDGSVITYKCFCDVTYPDAIKIIPDKKDCKELKEIGINTKLLNRLADGMGCDIPILHLYFFDQRKSILVDSSHTDYEGAMGIIMPVNIDNNYC